MRQRGGGVFYEHEFIHHFQVFLSTIPYGLTNMYTQEVDRDFYDWP